MYIYMYSPVYHLVFQFSLVGCRSRTPAPPLGRSRPQDTPVEGGWHNSEIAKSD